MLDVPDEVLLRIFKLIRLDTEGECADTSKIRLVCRRWGRVAANVLLHQLMITVGYPRYYLAPCDLKEVDDRHAQLMASPHLLRGVRHLVFKVKQWELSDSWKAISENPAQLPAFTAVFDDFCHLMKACPGLRGVHFPHMCFTSRILASLAEVLQESPHLHGTIRAPRFVESIESIPPRLFHSLTFRSLRIQSIEDKGIPVWGHVINTETLEAFTGADMYMRNSPHILQALGAMPNLKKLTLLDAKGLAFHSPVPRPYPKVKHLRIFEFDARQAPAFNREFRQEWFPMLEVYTGMRELEIDAKQEEWPVNHVEGRLQDSTFDWYGPESWEAQNFSW